MCVATARAMAGFSATQRIFRAMASPADTIRYHVKGGGVNCEGTQPNREMLQWGVCLPQATTRLTSRVPLTLHYHTIRHMCMHLHILTQQMLYADYIHRIYIKSAFPHHRLTSMIL